MASNSKNLKVEELLKEVRLDYTSANTKIVDDFVSSIRAAIDGIPDDLEVDADLASGFLRDIGADKVGFKFKKPKSVEISGSYSFHCITKPDVNVDVFVRLPKECFHEKDYLNHRYHAKRFLYLCVIKKYLKSSKSSLKVKWSTFQNEARKPILVIHPAKELVEIPGFSIRLIPTATSLFGASKLKLERNNVRSFNQSGVPQPTPVYNSSILEDMGLEENAEFVKKSFVGWKELGEALILLKIWASQRSSIYAHDCLNGYLLSVILSYLATESGRRRINNSMNTLQIFRIVLDFIAASKSWDNGLFFKPQGENNIPNEERKKYLQTFPVVMCDPFACYNMAFRITKSGLQELRDEAALTINCIDKCRDGGFDEIFMTKVDFPAKFDYNIRLNLKGHADVYKLGFCLDNECWRLYEQKIVSVMQEGLGDRSKFVRVIWRNTSSTGNIENGLAMFDSEPALVGISISSFDEASKRVTKGPSPENVEEALKFRKFWGNTELRSFGDGTIVECAFWDCKPWDTHVIIKKVAEQILVRHLSLSKEKLSHTVDQLDFSLLHADEDPIYSTKNLLDALNVLSSKLRSLKDTPLRITSVQPLDSAFRRTSVCPPSPHPLAYEKNANNRIKKVSSTCIQSLEVMIQLEGSGKWPLDEVALEKTKSAFLLRIGESLQNNFGIRCSATEEEVDVLLSGYAFRLKILHERALGLSKRQPGSDKAKKVSSIDKTLFIRSQHSSMISGLLGRYPIYGPVVRLAKRWVAAHLFSAILIEEAVELLVAYLFLKPLPFSAPCSRITGFVRFLRLLSEYDWTFSSLIVDINGDLTSEDEKEINDNFMLSRKSYGEETKDINPAMFLATGYDKASEAWTSSSPNSSEIKRLAAYARSSSNLLTRLVVQNQIDSYGWECVFRTPLNNYDAVVLLHRDKLPYPERLLFPSELHQGRIIANGKPSKTFQPFISAADIKSSSLDKLKDKFMVDFNPVRCYINDLETKYPDMFKVWYDYIGGDVIGLTWDKEGLKKRARGDDDDDGAEIDVVDALKGVGRVGKGFVRSVYSLKVPRLTKA
jgi:U3 small nucleolar RNA-associated protein 22